MQIEITPSLERRFWAKVDTSGECWLWTGSLRASGDGQIATGGRTGRPRSARLVSWLIDGRVLESATLMDSCGNKRCVRPTHLHPATIGDATRQAAARSGRTVTCICAGCGVEFRRGREHAGRTERKFCTRACFDLHHPQTLTQALERYVVRRPLGCWEWTGPTVRDGYGVVNSYGRRGIGAHRASWIVHRGTIPPGLHVLHRCDNPPCTNPDHLFLGTTKDNVRDLWDKGRGNAAGRRTLLEVIAYLLWRLNESEVPTGATSSEFRETLII